MGAQAGMHLALLVGDRIRDREIAAEAIRFSGKFFKQRLSLSPLSASYLEKSPQQGFVLGFGNAPVAQIPAAVHLLKKLLR